MVLGIIVHALEKKKIGETKWSMHGKSRNPGICRVALSPCLPGKKLLYSLSSHPIHAYIEPSYGLP